MQGCDLFTSRDIKENSDIPPIRGVAVCGEKKSQFGELYGK